MATSEATQPTRLTDASLWSPPTGAESPPAETPPADAPAASSLEPATEASSEPPTEGEEPGQQPGPIPLDRHKSILESERTKYSDLERKYQAIAWAENLAGQGHTPEHIGQMLQAAELFTGHPQEFLSRYAAAVSSDPALAEQLRSWAARVLGSQASSATADAEPQPDLISEDGNRVYSAQQSAKWMDWRDQKLEAKIAERLAPLTQTHERLQQAERAEQVRQTSYDATSREIEELREYPHFTEHAEAIRDYMRSKSYAIPVKDAYLHILRSKVFPTLTATAKVEALADIKRSAAASSASPSAATPSTPVTARRLDDPSLWR